MLDNYELIDRYRRESGRVLLTGTQALCASRSCNARWTRLPGFNTAGFVSGYRGSPLGMYDLELWRAKRFLEENNIEFLPAVNEDLAATAMLGSQQVETDPGKTVDGVFGMWYGKGPGVDRAGDALKHGNAYGSSPTGAAYWSLRAMTMAAFRRRCRTSLTWPFLTFMMPHLNPASVAEYLEYGLYGIRTCLDSPACGSASRPLQRPSNRQCQWKLPAYPAICQSDRLHAARDGTALPLADFPGPQIEERLEQKKNATLAFAAANPIDRKIFDVPDATFGIVTTGKGHHDLMEALRLLGIEEAEARKLGIDVYKVGMVWPLEPQGALDFVRGKTEVLVVEEKRGIIESQFKEYFYDYPGNKPKSMVGKESERGNRLVPWVGELTPLDLVPIVAKRLDHVFGGARFTRRAEELERRSHVIEIAGAQRIPYFCSGCPHNTSTKVPEGSKALAGIGCHFMASWMDRDTDGLIQMGGEGVNWIARSKFNGGQHVFQNLGDGTFYHSGSLAIRQAIAAGTNITYKILFNDAVAMTGGQPVDGPMSVHGVAQSIWAEGVRRIAIVSDEPDNLIGGDFPPGTTVSHRRDLDAVQRELRDIPGVTALIYAQTCATEKRRRRKRGTLEDPGRFVVINELVCEACGDCSVESNCLSVVPKATPFGRKRQIDQNSCNKDYACVNGFCPSFVTVEGRLEKRMGAARFDEDFERLARPLPLPEIPAIRHCYDLLVTGVGGTGVITVGALITMAAHLERKGATELDFMGFAQKFGPVLSYLRIANEPANINQVRIEKARADALIGCDLVVSSSPKASITYQRDHTRVLLNTAEMPTGDFVRRRNADLRVDARVAAVANAVGEKNLSTLDANRLAERIMGDTIYANVMMVGAAWQLGLVPVSLEALLRAIELNGIKVEENTQAFTWGRIAAHDPSAIERLLDGHDNVVETTESMIERRRAFLVDYQDEALGERFIELISRVRAAEAELGDSTLLTQAIAQAYFRLLSYKDEYEVARLHSDPSFLEQLREDFGKGAKLRFHLAPPLLGGKPDARGRPRKREFGGWILPLFRMLARLRRLRGTALDVFGYTAERRMERQLIVEFEQTIERVVAALDAGNIDVAVDIANAYRDMRGFGPVKDLAVTAGRERVDELLDKLEQVEAEAA